MSTKKVENPQDIYQIKVTLLDTSPPIWRRLLVPANLTLEQLHDVLQLTMGWEGCHMHDFRIGQKRCFQRAQHVKHALHNVAARIRKRSVEVIGNELFHVRNRQRKTAGRKG